MSASDLRFLPRRATTWTRLWVAAALVASFSVPIRAAEGDAPATITLALSPAWFEGRIVHCVTTDVSDEGFAKLLGVNYVPRLAYALPPVGSPPGTPSAVEKVYLFPKGEQANIYPSSPVPVGAANKDRNYSPLWVVTLAQWKPGSHPRTLKSEEELLRASEKGELELTPTRVVANVAVVRDPQAGAIKGVK
jgi:hypothetical protein